MPKFRNPKFLLLPLIAFMAWSAFTLQPSSASAEVRVRDGFKITTIPAARSGPNIVTPNWVLPTQPTFGVVNEFLRPTSDWGAGHRGIDFEVAVDQPLLAPHKGVVTSAGMVFDVPTVVITNPDSTSSVFQPACLNFGVKRGASVVAGQEFGTYCPGDGSRLHCGALSCVHWGFRLDKAVYLNPLRMLKLLLPSKLEPIDRIAETSA